MFSQVFNVYGVEIGKQQNVTIRLGQNCTVMADNEMPKAELNDEQMKRAKAYAKYLEAQNFMRAVHAKKLLRQKRIIFGVCWGLVFGAYGFTILRVKQETFLDDFEEPPREIKH